MKTSKSIDYGKKSIQSGSKSFRLASLILDKKTKQGAYALYQWCRHCDDEVDQTSSQEGAQAALRQLRLETEKAIDGVPHIEGSPYAGIYSLVADFRVQKKYFFELLEGFRMDADGDLIATEADLDRYCYHVAGVVGLMMTSILRAKYFEKNSFEKNSFENNSFENNSFSVDALKYANVLKHADALGRAMQLTNISRDVREDFLNQRIYIPRDWIQKQNLEALRLLDADSQISVFVLVEKLLARADELYIEGRQGLIYLPFRAGWSICVASFLYQGIGQKIKRLGPASLKARTVLSGLEKIHCVLLGTLKYFFILVKKYLGKNTERLASR